MQTRLAAGSFALALALSAAPGRAAQPCSSDVLTIDGVAVTVAICAPAALPRSSSAEAAPALSETISAQGRSITRQVPLEPLNGAEAQRTIDDAPLQKLGFAKALHLTILYKPGSVKLAHALLVPGAISLK